jgi:cytochrome c553
MYSRQFLITVKNHQAHEAPHWLAGYHFDHYLPDSGVFMRIKKRFALSALALFVMGVSLTIAAPALNGDPAKGKTLATDTCSGCHGIDGNSETTTFPKLAGQHATYLLKELKDYKAEHRVSEIMLPMTAALSDQDMIDVALYYASQKPKPAEVTKPDLLAIGKKLYLEGNSKNGVPSCDGCHEEDGSGSARFPRVAGQHVDYTLEELKRYSSGKRNYGTKVMRTVAERLTPQEAEAVAQYMASMK